jgi:hypothetical protein
VLCNDWQDVNSKDSVENANILPRASLLLLYGPHKHLIEPVFKPLS